MSFAKAQELLRIALLASARRGGISLQEICAEFNFSHRTEQRMTDAMAATFANVTTENGPDRRRRWRLNDPVLARLQPRQESTVEALEIAARSAREDNRLRHARALENLREGLIAWPPPLDALRAEADAEAVLSTLGHVARPGPKVVMRPDITDAVIAGLRGPFRLRMLYGDHDATARIVRTVRTADRTAELSGCAATDRWRRFAEFPGGPDRVGGMSGRDFSSYPRLFAW